MKSSSFYPFTIRNTTYINDSGDNDIINKPIPSINRSLPSTPMAGINTTTCVLTIGNSSLNAKFECLELKLCGKIIAMDSHFIDEPRSSKNETTINKEQNRGRGGWRQL